MTKAEFYSGKHVTEVEWWLHDCDLPQHLTWARLRVFNNGTADSTFDPQGKLFGFENRNYASFILSEDEYVCFNHMDEEDEQAYGIRLAETHPPSGRMTPTNHSSTSAPTEEG
jgi:hypothetical protein